MRKFKRLLFVIAIVFALLSTYLAQKILFSIAEEQNELNVIEIPVAASDIPAMTTITSEDIAFVTVPKEFGEGLFIMKDKGIIVDQTALVTIEKNNPFLTNQLIAEKIEIPFRLSDDDRAITIHSSPVVSVGGYLKEGVYVDILWTYSTEDGYRTSVAFQNVKVLAIGPPNHSEISGDERTITLKLTLHDAQKLTFMERNGELKLLLRPSNEAPTEASLDIDFSRIKR